MFPRGIIYQKGKSKKHGEINLEPSIPVKLTYIFLRGLGGGLIGAMVLGLIFTYGPIIKEEVDYLLFGPRKEVLNPFSNSSMAGDVKQIQEEAKRYGVDAYFSVVIPKIGAKSNIIANVDAGDIDEYLLALERGVAHAKGTHFPGQGEAIFLFAHSTDSPANVVRYNATFYLLKKLEAGDKILVFFADKKYEYFVSEKVITSAKDISWLSYDDGEETLIMQTCDPPGTNLKRLIIVAKRQS